MKQHLDRMNLLPTIMVAATMIMFSSVIFAQTHTVEITNFEIKPSALDVQSGDTVVFTNLDIVPHTATADVQSWDTGDIATGESKEITIEKDMLQDFFCKYHLIMKGKLIIK